VVQTLSYQHRRLKDHSLMKDRRDVVMTTSTGDQTSCRILYQLEATDMDVGNPGKK